MWTVSRSTKSAAESAEKPAIIFGVTPSGKPKTPILSHSPGPALVLDTNVVLDWLLFNDMSAAPLAAAITRRQVRWIATLAMRNELSEVLRRGLAVKRGMDPMVVLARWDAQVELVAEPLRPAVATLRCTDPDDQKFLDLAQSAGARWLLSRDRAVLRLARKAQAQSLHITVPERWSPPP